MRKLYLFVFAILSIFAFAQPYSSLLKNADWTITKIQWNGVGYYPPSPFMQSGKADFKYDNSNGFKSSFYNSAVGTVDFAPDNLAYFKAHILGITLAVYSGENDQLVNQFDNMVTSFYFGYPTTAQFPFEYNQVFSGKNLVVTNPAGNKIFYSNLILASSELPSKNRINIYPNPAKYEFFINSNKNTEHLNVTIIDASGKTVYSKNIISTEAINVKNFPAGIYIVKISGLGLNYSSKLVVKK